MSKAVITYHTKSFYRIRVGSHFYGTEYEIWTNFGHVGNTEKKIWRPVFFHVFVGPPPSGIADTYEES